VTIRDNGGGAFGFFIAFSSILKQMQRGYHDNDIAMKVALWRK
jgi:hypothetical protein